jgi:hypothetical protein
MHHTLLNWPLLPNLAVLLLAEMRRKSCGILQAHCERDIQALKYRNKHHRESGTMSLKIRLSLIIWVRWASRRDIVNESQSQSWVCPPRFTTASECERSQWLTHHSSQSFSRFSLYPQGLHTGRREDMYVLKRCENGIAVYLFTERLQIS